LFFFVCFSAAWRSSERGREIRSCDPRSGCHVPLLIECSCASSSAFIAAPSGRRRRWDLPLYRNVSLALGQYVGCHALFASRDRFEQSAVTLRQRRLTGNVRMEMARGVKYTPGNCESTLRLLNRHSISSSCINVSTLYDYSYITFTRL